MSDLTRLSCARMEGAAVCAGIASVRHALLPIERAEWFPSAPPMPLADLSQLLAEAAQALADFERWAAECAPMTR